MNIPKLLITLGIVLVIVGLLWPFFQKIGLGRLPGDIVIEREHSRFYFPLTTSIIISILLTLLFWMFRK
jgi:ribose/xylose/arabinose/galactoside ABC-type transport system permease subunit